jgi:hypothetical protein
MKKQINIVFIAFGFILSFQILNAQTPKFQLFTEYGQAFNLLNKKVYAGNNINSSPQLGGALRLKLSNSFSFGLEAQKRNFSLQKNILDTYDQIPNQNPFTGNLENKESKILNALAGIYFTKTNKKQTNLFEIGLSGGLQKLNLKANTLTFNNPFQLGAVDTLYSNKDQKNTKPMMQFSIANTFFIKKIIGIRFGVKFQYAPVLYETTYKELGINQTFAQLCNAATITQSTYNPLSVIPTIGLVIPLGFGNNSNNNLENIDKENVTPKEVIQIIPTETVKDTPPEKVKETPKEKDKKDENSKKSKSTCFTFKRTDSSKDEKCVSDDKLKFNITLPSTLINVIRYEVYLAPINDLDNKTQLFTLPYPTSTFTINTKTLDIGKEYFVIVKIIYRDEGLNCAQMIGPVKRCDQCCLDKTESVTPKTDSVTPKGTSLSKRTGGG